jgi:DME family drug/metabolite transporter
MSIQVCGRHRLNRNSDQSASTADYELNSHTKGALLVMGAGCLWGTFGILTKTTYALTTLGPISLAWYRLVFAIPFVGFLVAFKRYPISVSRREVLLFLAFGFFSLTLFEAIYFTSLSYTTVQHAAALLYTAPAFVAVLSWVLLRERMTSTKILAIVLSISGAFLILSLAENEPLFASRTQIGDWLALCAGLAYSSWYIFGKVLGSNREPAVTSLLGMCIGAAMLLPLSVAIEGFRVPLTLTAWELVAAVGLIPTAMAYLLYLAGLKLIEATSASVFAITEPLTSAILAFFIFQETLSYTSLVGFGLIISSILLISRAPNQ